MFVKKLDKDIIEKRIERIWKIKYLGKILNLI